MPDVEERVLVAIQQQERRGTRRLDLPTQLRPDGSAGAGDQHTFAGNETPNRLVVESHGRAGEQVFHCQLADVADIEALADQVSHSRERRNTHLVRAERPDNLAQGLPRSARNCDEHFVGLVLFQDLRQLVSGS